MRITDVVLSFKRVLSVSVGGLSQVQFFAIGGGHIAGALQHGWAHFYRLMVNRGSACSEHGW